MSVLPATAIGSGAAAASPALRTKRFAMALLPFLLILAWTVIVRLPFFAAENGDEYFFALVADQWLHGGMPYVTAFDIKPPGIFFIYALVQGAFGESHAVVKWMEITAVALGAWGLYGALRHHASNRMAVWTASLFPVCTLAFDGITAANLLLQIPFIILGFAAALAAIEEGGSSKRRLVMALLAGLAVGIAGTVKQTAIFEAAAIAAVLCIYGGACRLRLVGAFAIGAATPFLAFASYFLAVGHFHEMFEAVVVLALGRTGSDVAAGYGPDLAPYLTLPGAALNAILRSAPLAMLWAGAIFAFIRLRRIREVVPPRVLVAGALWLGAAFLGAIGSRLLDDYYLLAIVAPLLVLGGAFYCHGLDLGFHRPALGAAMLAGLTGALVVFGSRESIFWPNPVLAGDQAAMREVAAKLADLGLGRQDQVLVLNRGLSIYGETGARPPSPYFHPTHLLAVFPTPSPDPLGVALAANARFVIVANPAIRHVTESPARYDRAFAYLAAHYRTAAVVTGADDSFTIYEFAG